MKAENMNAENKHRTRTGCLWILAIIVASIACSLLAYYLDCSYLSQLARVAAGAGSGIVGATYFNDRKAETNSVSWWKWALLAIGLLAFAGLLTWIFE